LIKISLIWFIHLIQLVRISTLFVWCFPCFVKQFKTIMWWIRCHLPIIRPSSLISFDCLDSDQRIKVTVSDLFHCANCRRNHILISIMSHLLEEFPQFEQVYTSNQFSFYWFKSCSQILNQIHEDYLILHELQFMFDLN